jgi:hypothetical protein
MSEARGVVHVSNPRKPGVISQTSTISISLLLKHVLVTIPIHDSKNVPPSNKPPVPSIISRVEFARRQITRDISNVLVHLVHHLHALVQLRAQAHVDGGGRLVQAVARGLQALADDLPSAREDEPDDLGRDLPERGDHFQAELGDFGAGGFEPLADFLGGRKMECEKLSRKWWRAGHTWKPTLTFWPNFCSAESLFYVLLGDDGGNYRAYHLLAEFLSNARC